MSFLCPFGALEYKYHKIKQLDKMKELSQKISVVCISQLLSDQNWSGSWAADDLLAFAHQYHAEPFTLDPQPVDGTGGECHELIIDHPIDTVEPQPFTHPTSAIVLYKVSGKDEYIKVGTRELPATVQIIKGLNNCLLKISCRMLKSPF